MKSPRFDTRAAALRRIFSPRNLEAVWTKKVRVALREQFLNDGIEHFDFHIARRIECQKLSHLILSGEYVPERAQRILVEKSKGLCRQLVIPSAKDALVLQCLSDAFYADIRSRAPTDRAFFEPKEHRFSSQRSQYGTFASWLNFQRELFSFSRARDYVVVTDIANYYDSISYIHLRNVISSMLSAEESVLDMLIYVLAGLLWQPDYMPRVEIGLPQINLDAPRVLAHCFLYELDAYLASDPSRDFVRYMDDIDVGVDSIAAAKDVLKSIDLVLQTKQVRLNSGKTIILSRMDAIRHFRIIENGRLDRLQSRIQRKIRDDLPLHRERRVIELRVQRGLAAGHFDDGNGDKILKRLVNLAAVARARITPNNLLRMFLLRPTVRENVCSYIRRSDLTLARSRVLAEAAESRLLVDNAGVVDLTNQLVETTVKASHGIESNIRRIIQSLDPFDMFGLYCKLWLQSKYDTPSELLETITSSLDLWAPHDRLGRIIGGFQSLFVGTAQNPSYLQLLSESRNSGIRDAYKFHARLASEVQVFNSMYDALQNPNSSRGTGITHSKFLCLLSALRNQNATAERRARLRDRNHAAWRDVYYRRTARRLGV